MPLALLAVAASLTPAAAREHHDEKPIVSFTWTVAKDGTLLVHPHPLNQRPDDPPESLVDFGRGGNRTFLDDIKSMPPPYPFLPWLGGGLSLAGLTDAEHHFRMLGLGLSDEALTLRVASPASRDMPEPLAVRARLDRLLAVRLCGQRKIAAARGALEGIARDAEADRLLRDAARQSLALLDGQRSLDVATDLPPLPEVLALLPGDYDILAVVRPHRAPILVRPCHAGKLSGRRQLRSHVKLLGGAVTPAHIIGCAMAIDVFGELNYELARSGMNFRLDRVVTAGQVGILENGPTHGTVVMEGVLPLEDATRLVLKKRSALERSGAEIEQQDASFVIKHPNAEAEVSEGRVVLRFGPGPRGRLAGGLDGEWGKLRELGVDGDDIFWAYQPDLSAVTEIMPDGEPFGELKFLESALIRVSCREGIEGSVTMRFWDEQAAVECQGYATRYGSVLAEGLRTEFEVRPGSVLQRVATALAEARAERAGTSLTETIAVRGVTPQELLEAFLLAEPKRRDVITLGGDDDGPADAGDADADSDEW
jgi:hypothetical protein